MTVYSGDEEGWSQWVSKLMWSFVLGGLSWSQGILIPRRVSLHQGGAGEREDQGGAKEHGRATKGRAEQLKGASRDKGEELEGVGRIGGSGRLGGTSDNEADKRLGGTSGDWNLRELTLSIESYISVETGHRKHSSVAGNTQSQ